MRIYKVKDLTTKIFGRLHPLFFIRKEHRIYWTCRCDCGGEITPRSDALISGRAKSCGCLQIEHITKLGSQSSIFNITHGQFSNKVVKPSPEFISYRAMITRCYTITCKEYPRYGGCGIKVCDRWLGKYGFTHFFEDMGPRPKGKTLDRFPNQKGNYELSNCRWATYKEQALNTKLTSKTKDRKLWKQCYSLGLYINYSIIHYKRFKYENLLGCTLTEARKHIESQFKDGMSWDNYGLWQIDHIKSLRLFDFSKEDDIIAAFHHTNLQPMWKPENDRKK